MESPGPVIILKKSTYPITDINFWNYFSGDNKPLLNNQINPAHLITGFGDDGGIYVWDLTTRRVVAQYSSDEGIVSVFGVENGQIVMLSRDGVLKLLELKNKKLHDKHQLNLTNVGFCKASCLLHNNMIMTAVVGEETSSISIWNFTNREIICRLLPVSDSKLGMLMCVKLFILDNNCFYVLGGYEDGSVHMWNVSEERMLSNIKIFEDVPVICMDFNTTVMCGVVGSPSKVLIKFEVEKGTNYNLKVIKTVPLPNAGIADVKIRPDGKILAASGWKDGGIRIFSLKTLKPLAILTYHDGTVQALTFRQSSDSSEQILASGSQTNKIAIWKIYNS